VIGRDRAGAPVALRRLRPGAANTVVLVLAERLGIVVFTNGMPIGIPGAIAAEVLDLAETGAVNRD